MFEILRKFTFLPVLACIACLCCILVLVKILKSNKYKNEEIVNYYNDYRIGFIIVVILMILITVFSNKQIIYFLGNRDLENIPNGEYYYNVEIESENGEKHILPGKISIDYNELDYVKNDEVKTVHIRVYKIEKLYWSNGKQLLFDNYESVQKNEIARQNDQYDRTWECKILDSKPTNLPFEEKVEIDLYNLFEVLFITLILMFFVIINEVIRKKFKNEINYYN